MYYYVYIVASGKNGTLYIGITNDIKRRIWQHKHDLVRGFTREYGVHNLVYYEQLEDIEQAILREKKLKKWKRFWKIKLINSLNPEWKDLYSSIIS